MLGSGSSSVWVMVLEAVPTVIVTSLSVTLIRGICATLSRLTLVKTAGAVCTEACGLTV